MIESFSGRKCIPSKIQLTFAISNNRLSRSENLVPEHENLTTGKMPKHENLTAGKKYCGKEEKLP